MRVCLTINLRCMLRLLASPLFIDLIGKRVCVACLFICVLVYVIFVCLEPVEVISVQCVPKILAKNYWAGMSTMYIGHNLQYSK